MVLKSIPITIEKNTYGSGVGVRGFSTIGGVGVLGGVATRVGSSPGGYQGWFGRPR